MFVVGQEQQKVFAHRCVLACRCQAFRGMLSQAPMGSQDSSSSITPQGPFILGNVQPEVFLAVIEFLYTNSVTLNSHIVSGDGVGGDHGHGRDKKGMQGKLLCNSWCARAGGEGLCAVGCPEHLVPPLGPLAVHTLDGENGGTTAGDLNFSPCSSLISHAPLRNSHRGRSIPALYPGLLCPSMAPHADDHKVPLACRHWRC